VLTVNLDIYVAGYKKKCEVTTVSADKGWVLPVSWQDRHIGDANLYPRCYQTIAFQLH